MKKLLCLLALSLALLALAPTARAGVITWGPATNISGDTDVKNDGTLFGALNIGADGVSSTSVNGVTFQAAAFGPMPPATFGHFQFNAVANFLTGNFFGSSDAFFTSLSSGYQSLLSSAVLNFGGFFTLTISGLTVGDQYEFEWWNNDSRSLTTNRTETASDGAGHSITLNATSNGATGGLGQFAVGTFAADATSQVITFSQGGSLNGLQLRDITPAAVPEPGSLTLMAVGIAGLVGYGWRKRKQAA